MLSPLLATVLSAAELIAVFWFKTNVIVLLIVAAAVGGMFYAAGLEVR